MNEVMRREMRHQDIWRWRKEIDDAINMVESILKDLRASIGI